jgi:nitrite reductase/ring-hydroxylating ferredoxin subunit
MPHIEILLESLPSGVPFRIEHATAAVVVFRTGESVSAFEDSCPHAHWRLSEGEVTAGVLECPGHGWEFNILTGHCLSVPAYRLKPYHVTVSNGVVRIDCDEASSVVCDMTICGKAG